MHMGSNHVKLATMSMTYSCNIFCAKRRARYRRNACPLTLLMDARAKRLYPWSTILQLKGIVITFSTYGCIHLFINVDVIPIFIQGPKSLTLRDDPKPLTNLYRHDIKPHSASANANKHDTVHYSAFTIVSPINSTTSTTITDIDTHQSSPQCDVNIPRMLETCWTIDRGSTLIPNHKI